MPCKFNKSTSYSLHLTPNFGFLGQNKLKKKRPKCFTIGKKSRIVYSGGEELSWPPVHNSENRSCRAAGTPHLLHFTGRIRRFCSGSAGAMRLRWSSLNCISAPGGRCRCTLHPGAQSWAANHTDHQGGYGLAAAVTLDLVAVAARNTDGYVRVKSRGFNKLDVIDLATAEPQAGESTHSASLIRGIAEGFRTVVSRSAALTPTPPAMCCGAPVCPARRPLRWAWPLSGTRNTAPG